MLQLSVVIIGIMVTFIGSDLIGRWTRAQQVKDMMMLVVEELKTNREQLADICQALRHDRHGMLMFMQYEMNIENIPTDSLEKYMFIIGSWQDFSPQADALEALKISGLSSSIGDKQLLMDVLKCYNELSYFGASINSYNQRKKEAINHLFANNSTQNLLFYKYDARQSWVVLMSDPLCYSFISNSSFYFGDDSFFDRTTP